MMEEISKPPKVTNFIFIPDQPILKRKRRADPSRDEEFVNLWIRKCINYEKEEKITAVRSLME